MFKKQWKWLLPLAAFALFAPFTPQIDLATASFFYKGDGAFAHSPFLHFCFKYGEVFAFMVAGAALLLCLLSFFWERARGMRRGALALVLTLVLGAGVIVNLGFKDHWGRPRPKQLSMFGGKDHYRPFWQPHFGGVSGDHKKSFPSGHSAMGFYYLSLILVGRRYRNIYLTYCGGALTLFWGGALMYARVAQGAHFVSDVLASPVIMWSVALAIDYLLFSSKEKASKELEV